MGDLAREFDESGLSDRSALGMRARLDAVHETVRRLEHRLGRVPRAREVADELGWTLASFHAFLAEAAPDAARADEDAPDAPDLGSIDAICVDMPRPWFGDGDDPVNALQQRERLQAFASACEQLSERERQVLRLIYVQGLTLRRIGAALGVTESRACQLHAGIVCKLRKRLVGW